MFLRSKAIRTVIRWQLGATAAMTLFCAWLAGVHGAVSAALGGLIGVCAGCAFSLVVSLSKPDSLAGTLVVAFRAEAVKLVLAAMLLWLGFAAYAKLVAPAFIGCFAVSILIFGMAFFVRDA